MNRAEISNVFLDTLTSANKIDCIGSLRKIFDNSLAKALSDIQEQRKTCDEVLYTSWAAYDYILSNVTCIAYDELGICEDDQTFGDYDDYQIARNKTIDFFRQYEVTNTTSCTVEKFLAKIVITPLEYNESSLRFHEFPDEVVLDFFQRAIAQNLRWESFDGADVFRIEKLIKETDLTIDTENSERDNEALNSSSDALAIYQYVCDELSSGRSAITVYPLAEYFINMICPELTLNRSGGNWIEVYHDDLGVTEGVLDRFLIAFQSKDFSDLQLKDFDSCDDEVHQFLDKHFI
ncbi:TPA: hypothetical protein NIE69_002082 [Pseudomonas aeruginosa]|nr:hypothetical protein [Pseudomonas aeruginosa]